MRILPRVLVSLVVVACGPEPGGDGAKKIAVKEIAQSVVLPTLRDVASGSATLAQACEDMSRAPSLEHLTAVQAAWRDTRAPWERAAAFAFGPATDLRIAVAIDQSPVEVSLIEQEIAGTAEFTVDHIDNLGANRKGFHAMEWLLFDAAGGDDMALAQLTTGPLAARRLQLLSALAADVQLKTQDLLHAWQTGKTKYVETLTNPGVNNEEFPTIKAVIDRFVNESTYVTEGVADSKLGRPLGNASGGVPQPALEESGPSDNSLQDIADNLRGVQNVYLGTRTGEVGGGLSALVRLQSAATDREVRSLLQQAIAAVDAVPHPFAEAVVQHRKAVQRAYDAVKELKSILSTEVVAVLGSTLTFNGNDGD